jgi:pimeloyl-ACP methyl ester carboxylesterase
MGIVHATGRARSGALSIHFRRLGTPGRAPLLIVHGLSYFSCDWLGDSDWSAAQDYSVPAMAQDIVNLLERPKLGVDMWQLLGEVRCPILSLRGARSDMYAAETVPKMQAANARLRVVEVSGAGHDIAGDNPQGLVAALSSFLKEASDEYPRH